MTYIKLDDYISIYPNDDISGAFDRLSWDASRLMDNLTTGVDGIRKLKHAAPVENNAEAVKRCACALIHTMFRLEQMEEAQEQAAAYVKNEDGTVHSAVIASRSAGNESINYANGSNLSSASVLGAAVSDPLTRQKLYRDTVTDYLSGAHDSNGVNLLYMGRYPRV